MFLHPWAVVLGLAAAGLPIAIHLLTKPKPVRMPLSTLRFLQAAVRQHRARHRLRDLIVLASRVLAVLLIAFAVARPKLGEQPLISDSQGGSSVRVVILDVSQSMAAVSGGVAALDRARTIAADHLRYQPGLRANLILAGSGSRATFTQPSQNFEALRKELSGSRVRPERLDINQAIALAAEMLALTSAEDQRRRELVVVSDFQRANWARADFSALPRQTQIQLESARTAGTPANVALIGARVVQRSTVGGSTQLEVVIGNYSPTPRRISVEAAIGEATFRLQGMCPPNRRTTLAEEIQLREAGWQTGNAQLIGVEDALAADNQRPFAVEVLGKASYILLTRQAPGQRPSSSYYLERALAPVDVQRVDSAAIDPTLVTESDLIVIDHPGKLAAEEIGLLAGLLRRGRAILYVAAEPIDAANLRLLIDATAGELQIPVAFAPPPLGRPRLQLFLTSLRQDAAPFDVFGENTAAITDGLRFGGGLASRRLENTLDDDLLASYSDGSACLVLASSGTGTLAVLNADLNRSNLPTSSAFVPLLDQLVQRLLGDRRHLAGAVCGEPVVVRLPADAGTASELEITGPESEEPSTASRGELIDEGGGVVWRWQSPEQQGVYRVQRGTQTEFVLPVGISDEESSLESLAPEVLTDRLAGALAVHYRAANSTNERRDHFWTWLLTACVACMIAEMIALTAFKS